jgi:hypothetical protein
MYLVQLRIAIALAVKHRNANIKLIGVESSGLPELCRGA